ncbi:type II toxin-antitoxin system RelE/ParE family toxin [Candidatus Microgenomates bacterium]|nr:type II toxin-antitoxin system RelE/ParE family toxin [Candidatus Microgenomates bacterium]
MAWKVLFFQTTRGEHPVKTFIGEQDPMIRSKIAHSILLLKNQGPFLKPPDIKKLQDKLYELRISGTTQIRIFYTIYHSEYYLLHAFKKKSQKTPNRELKVVLDRMKEIL